MDDFEFTLEYERRKLRDSRTIMLSDDIDQPAAGQFIEDMFIIIEDDVHKPVTIVISSGGGNVFAGLAIIRSIRVAQRHGIKVIGSVYGHACSMALFILECCDDRIMGEFDMLMAHGVTTGFDGDMKSIEAETKLLTHWHGEFAELLAKRCGDEAGEWFEVLKDNTPQWYTANECIKMGLVDRIE